MWLHHEPGSNVPRRHQGTSDEEFWANRASEATVPTMNRTGFSRCAEDGDVDIVELPYPQHGWSMIIALRDAHHGWPVIEESLTTEIVEHWSKKATSTHAQARDQAKPIFRAEHGRAANPDVASRRVVLPLPRHEAPLRLFQLGLVRFCGLR